MLPGWEPNHLHNLGHLSWVRSVRNTDTAQQLRKAGLGPDDFEDDLSDVCNNTMCYVSRLGHCKYTTDLELYTVADLV